MDAAPYRQRGLVTIGIPTYDRAVLLRRALASALAQDYPHLEVIVSDNASKDGTPIVCAEAAQQDPRVRCLRQASNRGATVNFEAALLAARGEYFMWLADDDRIDADYVSQCVAALRADPALQLVAGRAVYVDGQTTRLEGEVLDVLDGEPEERVLSYYRTARHNGIFYGLSRTEALSQVLPVRRTFGCDWMVVASQAYRGGLATLPTTTIRRDLGGLSFETGTVRAMGLGPLRARAPFASMALSVAWDILRSPPYRHTAAAPRLRLALRCAAVVFRRQVLARRLSRHRPALASRLRRALPAWAYGCVRAFYRRATGRSLHVAGGGDLR